jgi:hypothetical protein
LGVRVGDSVHRTNIQRADRSELKEIEESSEVGLTDLKRTLTLILRGEAETAQAKKWMKSASLESTL